MDEYEEILSIDFTIESVAFSENVTKEEASEANNAYLQPAKAKLAFCHDKRNHLCQTLEKANIYEIEENDKMIDTNISHIVLSDLHTEDTKKEEKQVTYLNILEATDFEIESHNETVNQLSYCCKKGCIEEQKPDQHKYLSKFKCYVARHKICLFFVSLLLIVTVCVSISVHIWFYQIREVTSFQPDVPEGKLWV